MWDLPGCSQLRELSLANLDMQLAFSSPQEPGVLHGASTALTRLCITNCHVADGAAGFAAVAALTGLQHLSCTRTTGPGVWVPGSMLAPLQRLTYLQLSLFDEAATLQAISRLTGLQELRLDITALETPAAALSGLQHLQQLRTLCVDGTSLHVNASTMPFITRLTGLQHLALPMVAVRDSSFDPNLLATLHTRLQHLDLANAELRPGGTAALLAQLQQVQGLSCLRLTLDGCAAPPGAYAALTASSHLRDLEVSWRQLPCTVFDSMFPAGRQLPTTSLWFMDLPNGDEEAQPFTMGQLMGLAACCPGLRDVGLVWEGHVRMSDLAFLTRLSAVTSLAVSNVLGESGCAVLAKLKDLRHLELERMSEVDAGDLMQLTALQQLTRFELGFGCLRANSGTAFGIKNKAGVGEPSDVVVQLAQKCSDLLKLDSEGGHTATHDSDDGDDG